MENIFFSFLHVLLCSIASNSTAILVFAGLAKLAPTSPYKRDQKEEKETRYANRHRPTPSIATRLRYNWAPQTYNRGMQICIAVTTLSQQLLIAVCDRQRRAAWDDGGDGAPAWRVRLVPQEFVWLWRRPQS